MTQNKTETDHAAIEKRFQYRSRHGETHEFDTTEDACAKYGFFAGSRVKTPKGPAVVIGVSEGNLWFHVDGDQGASFWDNGKDYDALVFELGMELIDDLGPSIDIANQYKVKRIQYLGKDVSIILQNENGPCPLISIANVLLLQQKISLDSSMSFISLKKLGDLIIKHAKLLYADNQDILPIIEDYDKNVLPSLEKGLIVNIHFNDILGFEKTAPCQIFDYLHIKLVHGWIVDPEKKEVCKLVGSMNYNDLAPKVVNIEQSFPTLSLDDQDNIINFVNCNQLTEEGLSLILKNLEEDELVVFFRNNHFATMTKHDGFLHILVSDVGYEREKSIIWDRIISKDGESTFLSGNFKSRKTDAMVEVRSTLQAFGFKPSEIEEAEDYIINLDKFTSDDLLEEATKYLTSKNYIPQPL
ncbi:DUF544 family protein [Tieghemostelium lacteum]|uniref:DUF544 family protein n=1 Tax=Tieghemostelium lacteum TaxID=361077 RepID=A0A151ZF64_TIELA|nr:DUF544 family protein [Tieghemostelium lacteum]|eukprot:KYQ92611.1 DUF544 family protein [Tieghemostelium lacteum]